MTQLTRVVVWWLFMRNRPRILFQPTHLENLDQISRIELPSNPTKMFIPADSAWSIESFLIFQPGKTFLEKIGFSEFNLSMSQQRWNGLIRRTLSLLHVVYFVSLTVDILDILAIGSCNTATQDQKLALMTVLCRSASLCVIITSNFRFWGR